MPEAQRDKAWSREPDFLLDALGALGSSRYSRLDESWFSSSSLDDEPVNPRDRCDFVKMTLKLQLKCYHK